MGVRADEALGLARFALEQGPIQLDGMFSHFANSEILHDPMIPKQIERFKQAIASLNGAGIYPQWLHLSNSAGTLMYPEERFTPVRPGGAVLGLWPFDNNLPYPDYLHPAIAWKARLASCKLIPAGWGIGYGQTYTVAEDELIGAIPVGYADGFRRVPDNEVLVGGQKVPLRGMVCIDQTMIHLLKKYPMGEEVVLIGEQGNERIQTLDLAQRWKTAHWDVVAGINFRIPRVYL